MIISMVFSQIRKVILFELFQLRYQNIYTLPNQYFKKAENVQIFHRYHKLRVYLCMQFAGLILNM